MRYNPEIHHRKSIRLKDYDYSSEGLYFITICAYQMEHLFGKIVDDKMILNSAGLIVEKEINKTNEIRKNTKIEKYVIVPNHIHLIMEILETGFSNGKPLQETKMNKNVGCLPVANPNKLRPNTVSSIVNQIKSKITKEVSKNTNIYAVWQRNYYDNIIRNEKVYLKVLEYIENNPIRWDEDKYR